MSKNVDILKQRIEHYGATDKDWETAKQQLESEREERARQQKEAALQHQAWQKEQDKPKNAAPRFARTMHVKENYDEALEWAMKTPLEPLKEYAAELKAGQHRNDFRGLPTQPMAIFLDAIIKRREENHDNNELLQSMQKANKTLNHIDKSLNPNPTEKSRAYTT
jgi:hypothetical protein